MLEIIKAKSEEELKGILSLQADNLRKNLSLEEMKVQGFVTLEYNLEFLRVMPAGNHHVIAKDGEKVVGYVLLMDRSTNHLMTTGAGIFPIFNELVYKGEKFKNINYVSVGQVCVDKDYTGRGLLKKMYDYYRECYQNVYDLAMTDIAASNSRSIKGHLKTGFEIVKTFIDPDQKEPWDIVVWDWREEP